MGQLDLTKIIEVRRVLEVEIAGLAAMRATEEDTALLVSVLAEAEQGLDDEETFVRTDVAFHAALARATQNELFSVILSSISDILVEIRRVGWHTPGVATRAIAHHRRILECVQSGDASGAQQAMDEHMDEARDTLALGIKRSIAG
jgi:GntR family transcriptional repressor for pyruvate dehydrogenase complex